MNGHKPVVLCILDGVGIASGDTANALHIANTPTFDRLFAERPHSALRSDGEYVGVTPGQMGNSEVGHITIGAGRIIRQSLPQISADIEGGQFQQRPAFQQFCDKVRSSRAVHLIGLFSDGGIHSHIDHLVGICEALDAMGVSVFIHAITDGRDTGVNEAINQLAVFEQRTSALAQVSVVSVVGRFYAMDRDNRWDRSERAWRLYTAREGSQFATAAEAIQAGYADQLSDEHLLPSVIGDNDAATVQAGDAVFLFNFRADRMRQLTRCFAGLPGVDFDHQAPSLSVLATMTLYDAEFADHCCVIYPPEQASDTLGEVVANAGLKQLRIAETEKYPHVTFFLNNGREEPFDNEERTLVPSPRDVATYDLKPEMSLPEVTSKLVAAIRSSEYRFIALNIANGDMVGHTGVFNAAVQAAEHIDTALADIIAALDEVDGELLVIADHGNLEEMTIDGTASTTHSSNPVPCIYYGPRELQLGDGGLADVAPTVLQLLELPIPESMTGASLIR